MRVPAADFGAEVAVEVGVATVVAADDSLDYRSRPSRGKCPAIGVSLAMECWSSDGAAMVSRATAAELS
jgi:hypothetical protein